ncbi:hypothetical protein J2W14_004107 [Pseudarthrobacter oxydans]|uniref:hypothetical protein n=1 Tax=Pseudarthrobacter oxydans TaxID=1671 RepID=UPI0027818D5E|nr:hypothetical protein [Pseudarthrobacter oxydans]MDP9984680.1 hypothetical protein [Pseudarthrobacter oxydans]
MTTMIEDPPLHAPDDSDAARAHRALFSDPDVAEAPAARDFDTALAAQAPVFSSPS